MNYRLSKLIREVKELGVKDELFISKEDMNEICKLLSKEAGEDFRKACKDGYIGYSKLSKETLIELTEKLVIAGTGKETVIIIDDI